MGKLIPRLIGLFPKLEGGKHQVGLEAEVGMSTKGEKDQSGRDLWRGTFPGSDAHLLIFLGCLAWFLFCVLWKRQEIDPGSTLFFKGHYDQI